MRKLTKRLFVIVGCMFLIAGFSACGESCGDKEQDKSGVPARIEAEAIIRLSKYNDHTLKYEVYDVYGEKIQASVTVSSSDESVAKINGNVLEGYSVGTATLTYSAGDITATSAVTVTENEHVPKLMLDKKEVLTYVNGQLPVSAYLLFDGRKVTDISAEYTVENESIASVSDEGVVKGLVSGSTKLTVKAVWRGSEFLETINVKVSNLLSVGYEGKITDEIFTSDINGGQTSAEITPAVYKNGKKAELSENNVRFFECDGEGKELSAATGVISVSATGNINAVTRGETFITYEFTDGDDRYNATPVKITVQTPVVETGKTFTADLNASDKIDLNVLAAELGLTSAADIESVSVIKNGTEMFLELSETDVTGVDYKMEVFTVYNNEGYGQKIDAELYTLVISDPSELNLMSEFLDEHKYKVGTEGQYYSSDGYFVLDADIDYNGDTFESVFFTDLNTDRTNGFVGIFDGRGHTIKNLVMGYTPQPEYSAYQAYGLVSALGSGGVFRNLNLENYSTITDRVGIIGRAINGSVENISVSANGAALFNTGIFCLNIMSGATLKNIVITLENVVWNGTSEGAILSYSTEKTAKLRNIYVIDLDGSVKDANFESTWAMKNYYGDAFTYAIKDESGADTCAFFASEQDFKKGLQTKVTAFIAETSEYECDFSGFDELLWDFSGEIPVVTAGG